MAIYNSSTTKEIVLRQGDTGNIYFTSIPKDKNYNVYLAVFDPDANKILKEVQATSFVQAAGEAYFGINETVSNSLPVGEWQYYVKICADGSEDTILPRIYKNDDGDIVVENAPKFTVLNKGAEGD